MKEILNKIFPSVPYDKKLHFLAGLLIAILSGVIIDPMTGLGFAIAAGIFKECWDSYNDEPFDIFDMLVTWLGGAVGFALVSLINYWRT